MAVTGPPEWRPTGFWRIFAGFWLVSGILRLLVLSGELFDMVMAILSLALGGFVLIVLVPYRVRTDDVGIHLRGPGWRTKDLRWEQVADIRQRRPDRPGDPLVVVTLDGQELRTMLHPVQHRSLLSHWRRQVGSPDQTL